MSNQTRTWVDSVTDSVSDVTGSIKTNVKQPICDAINQIPYQEWKQTYFLPLSKEYDKWPSSFTQFKQNYILIQANENIRLICLGLSTLAVVSITKRFSPGISPLIRNSVMTYFGLGLVIAPEIYNPLLVKKNDNK
ncbi:unnamed protein product [Paramecium sonneborni]|uniref:Uncharacterized protein n=1 Tax=Paramecium sonneborni TaxID=65129 RepID=A0A8S1MHT0_9CILI|nr:unnamed protein product [Paramecium sonneborni]